MKLCKGYLQIHRRDFQMYCQGKDMADFLNLQGKLQPLISIQSQKTQGFCVADFATLSDKRMSRSKIFLQFNTVTAVFKR